MNRFEIRVELPHVDPLTAFETVSDFQKFQTHTEVVRDVEVVDSDADTRTSSWEVDFYGGVLRWVERDVRDRERMRITFEQITGDLAAFGGFWQVETAGDGSRVLFASEFDLDMPFIEDVVNPIAMDAFTDTMTRLFRGVFGDDITFDVWTQLAGDKVGR